MNLIRIVNDNLSSFYKKVMMVHGDLRVTFTLQNLLSGHCTFSHIIADISRMIWRYQKLSSKFCYFFLWKLIVESETVNGWQWCIYVSKCWSMIIDHHLKFKFWTMAIIESTRFLRAQLDTNPTILWTDVVFYAE